MSKPKQSTVIGHCADATKLINEARIRLRDAADEALETQHYELSKSLTSLANDLLGGVVTLLVSLPRLKG